MDEITYRQFEDLHRLSQGKHPREIAAELYITVDTVRTHRRHVNLELSVHSLEEAVKVAKEKGILPTGQTAVGDPTVDAIARYSRG